MYALTSKQFMSAIAALHKQVEKIETPLLSHGIKEAFIVIAKGLANEVTVVFKNAPAEKWVKHRGRWCNLK